MPNEVIQKLKLSAAELGHDGTVVPVAAPDGHPPAIHACLYQGNQAGEACVNGPYVMPFDRARDAWVLNEYGLAIGTDGTLSPLGPLDTDALWPFGVYVSPNPADVTLFMAAFRAALTLALPGVPQ